MQMIKILINYDKIFDTPSLIAYTARDSESVKKEAL